MAPKIAIIGAGPAGCTLARLLHLANIPCTVFEGETSIDYRSQGGTLDLRTHTGLEAIKEAGLWDEFIKYARYDGESLLICDRKKTTWVRRQPRKDGSKRQAFSEAPEIDRAQLRRMLLESVPKENIQWGKKLKSVDEYLTLHFADGDVEKGFDLVVGADGAWSKVRNLLSDEKPFYTGIGGYQLSIPNAKQKAPRAYELVNKGSIFAYDENKGLNSQQLGDGSINIGFWDLRDEDWIKGASNDLSTAKTDILQSVGHWHKDLVNQVENAEGPVVSRNLYMLPVGFQWQHKRGVTLIGDAAHLKAPFAGIGVNMALQDAVELAHAIINASKSEGQMQEDLDAHVIEYEKALFPRAKKGQELTYGSMKCIFFTKGAIRSSVEEWSLLFMKQELPWYLHPFMTVLVYTGFFFYKLFV